MTPPRLLLTSITSGRPRHSETDRMTRRYIVLIQRLLWHANSVQVRDEGMFYMEIGNVADRSQPGLTSQSSKRGVQP
jgi:hypothetical protein